jgi:putative OPT family oligopeptide transporter
MAAPAQEAVALPEAAPEHQPYVPDKAHVPEFTWPAVIVGAVLGVIFGASSLYLVLKVGLTVSASIPVAVLSITLFRLFSKLPFIRRATILENNIVQTTGSAGESIAFGVGVTMPALMLIGFEMEIGRVLVVSVLGGLLGILMMIPLRRAFIVKQHGTLKYPEGTACAQVLIVGEQGGSSAMTVFIGFGVAFIYQFLMSGLKLWKEVPARALTWFKGAVPAIEVNPALLGVGYIIGTRISCIMVAGGVLSSFVLIPAIRLFGDPLTTPVPPGTQLIKNMSEDEIWHDYVLYIGAGAVAAGGIISLFQALPLILSSIKSGLSDIRAARGGANGDSRPRTDRDLPLWIVGFGSILLVVAIWATNPLHQIIPAVPQLHMNLVGALLIVLFGFLFVTVSSRLTGEIGSSSNPISGMTVATLLLTCLIFLALSWTNPQDQLTALSVAGVVCIAASNGGTTSQDLKTGYLVGATPKWQQLAILVGALSSALIIGWILIRLNQAYTIYSDSTKDLPKLSKPVDVASLTETERAPNDPTLYHVWWVTKNKQTNPEDIPAGKYLVDDEGHVRYLVDPGINGKLTRRPDGTEVPRFKAPKAVLMGFITNGILNRDLPWSLVLLGVSIAIVLELSGVPSLPFAVGVYLPLSSSTPIFAGGLIRYAADHWGRNEIRSEADSDSSPGVLLSTGYIAGGAIAGVLIAFLSFSEEIPRALSVFQYRTYTVTAEQPLTAVYTDIAKQESGLSSEQVAQQPDAIKGFVADLEELNAEVPADYAHVSKGSVLTLPGKQEFTVPADSYLKDVAGETGQKALLLLDLNRDRIKPATTVPAGAAFRLLPRNTPSLVAFGILVVFLLLVGLGLLFKTPPLMRMAPIEGTPEENGEGLQRME